MTYSCRGIPSREQRYLLITNLHEEAKLTSLQICLVFERKLRTKYVAESRVESTESFKPEYSFSETSNLNAQEKKEKSS